MRSERGSLYVILQSCDFSSVDWHSPMVHSIPFACRCSNFCAASCWIERNQNICNVAISKHCLCIKNIGPYGEAYFCSCEEGCSQCNLPCKSSGGKEADGKCRDSFEQIVFWEGDVWHLRGVCHLYIKLYGDHFASTSNVTAYYAKCMQCCTF